MKPTCSIIFTVLLLISVSFADDGGKSSSDNLQKKNPVQLNTVVKDAMKSSVKAAPKEAVVPDENSIELGIESISENKDGTLTISVYILNPLEIAGFQMELIPSGLLEFETIQGGIAGDLGFMMKAGTTGRILGFSMQGTKIPIAESRKPEKNILFTVTAKLADASAVKNADLLDKKDKSRVVTLDMIPIMAGEKGVKLPVYTVPYKWTLK